MKRIFLCLALLINTFRLQAQNKQKVIIGGSFDIATKYSLETFLGFIAYEPSVYIRVEDPKENSLSFTGRVGLLFDPLRVDYGSGNHFSIVQQNIAFSGLINFPLRNENLKILVGIGVEFCTNPTIGYGTYNNAYRNNNLSNLTVDLDSASEKIETYRRHVLPSVSGGVSYRPPIGNKKFSVSFIFKQTLLNLFTENIEIPYQSGGNYNSVSINYKPSYLKLGLSYDCW